MRKILINSKIVDKDRFSIIRDKLNKENKTIVHCHGVFDLIHAGHIVHLNDAKNQGDILVVTITAQKYVQKGPGRPFFNDELRLMTLSAIDVVDYVILSDAITAISIIDIIKPDIYVKGQEYEISEDDLTANIDKETERVLFHGGKIYYTKGQVFSSTKLLNTAFNALPKAVVEQSIRINQFYKMSDIKDIIESFSELKILVMGDIIMDEYIFCSPQGSTSKAQAFSTRYIKSEMYLGGTAAIANHLSSFSKNVTLCSVIGSEASIHSNILNGLGKLMFLDLILNEDYKTVIKKKYVQKNGQREEYSKVFSVNNIQTEKEIMNIDMTSYHTRIAEIIDSFDMVVLCDFGHGIIDDQIIKIVQQKSKYLALNCQTNSSNYGANVITKYDHADAFTLDEREIMLAFNDAKTDQNILLHNLKQKLDAKYGWLTIGSRGALGIDPANNIEHSTALTLHAIDTVGAGDAFFALVALCAFKNVPIDIATLIGNTAGAIAANTLGNSEAVSKAKVLKYISTVLNV